MVRLQERPLIVDLDGYVVQSTRADTKQGNFPGHIDVYGTSGVQEWPLGTKVTQGDRCWRYAFNGLGALTIGMPVQNAAAAHAEQHDDIVVGAAAAAGATSIELTSTANLDTAPNETADDFAEGYMIVNDEAGEGQVRKIKSNEAFSGTANSTFTLYDGLETALTTSSQVGLIRNPFYKVITSAAVVSGMCMGVVQMAVAASKYFWVQTGGPAGVDANDAIPLGTSVVVGTAASSADPGAAATTEIIIGYPLTPGVADGEKFIVFLTLDS
jgi:hypothetical protein